MAFQGLTHTQREEKTPRRHLFNPSMSGLQEWLNFSHLMRLHKVFLECTKISGNEGMVKCVTFILIISSSSGSISISIIITAT